MIEYTIHGRCKRLADVPSGAMIHTVNDRNVIGICEACGWPVYEDTGYRSFEDGVIHGKCNRRAKP
jgi:hypothetical protein